MKTLYLLTLLLLAFQAPLTAQITPISVDPQALPALTESPLRITAIGNRLLSISAQVFSYSDDDGATWTSTPVPGDRLYDLLVAGTQVYVVAVKTDNDLQVMNLYRSDDLGLSFTLVHSITETQVWSNGNYANLLHDVSLFQANNAIYLSYTVVNKSGTNYTYRLRAQYTLDQGSNWILVSASVQSLAKTQNILYSNGFYVLVSNREEFTHFNNTPVIVSSSPDFSNYWALDFYAGNILSSAFINNVLYVVSDNVVYSQDNLQPGQYYDIQYTATSPLNATIIGDQIFYLRNNGIYRANATTSASQQVVFSGVFNRNYNATSDFVQVGSRLIHLSATPLRSDDGGSSWQYWSTGLPHWAGMIVSAGNHLYMDAGWTMRSADGQNFSLWQPQGLPAGLISWSTIVAHQNMLFLYTNQSVFRSSDQGQTWTSVLLAGAFSNGYLRSSGSRLFLMTSNIVPYVYAVDDRILYSDDAGLSWSEFANTTGHRYSTDFAAAGDSAFVQISNYLFFTHNRGQTWDTTALGLAYNPPLSYHQGRLSLTNSQLGRVYVSADGGNSFYQSTALPGGNTHEFWFLGDSLLLAKNIFSSATYISKVGNTHWVSFDMQPEWANMRSFAIFGDYLYGSHAVSNVYWPNLSPLSRIPLDQILDPLNALTENAGVVSGKIFFDLNQNCLSDAGDLPINSQVVAFQPGNFSTATNPDGSYGLALPPGTYQLQTTTPVYHAPFCFDPNTVLAANQGLKKDIAYQQVVAVQDLRVTLSSSALRPGQHIFFTLQVDNIGTLPTPAGVVLRFTYSPNGLTFLSADPAATSVNSGELLFTLPALPVYTSMKYSISLALDPNPALTGQIFYFFGEAINSFADTNPVNNKFTLPVIVTNSYDPNDKTVFTTAPAGDQLTLNNRSLRYLIRFQNTGTDTAFRVVLRDTLSPLLLATSIQTLSASGPYRFVLRNNHIAEWYFDPANLPDSSRNEAGSHGFVLFSIDAVANLAIGDQLTNRAAIYFDYNDPVMTNQTLTRVVRRIIYRDAEQPETLRGQARFSPNPAQFASILDIQETKPEAVWTLELLDDQGRLVLADHFTGPQYAFQRNGLAAGAYVWRLKKGTEMFSTGRLVVTD